MKLLIKLGGTLLDAAETRDRLAKEVASLAGHGDRVVVVHGGGKQLSRYLADRGVESRFINGLRVTKPETLEAVVKILAGQVNTQLVTALGRAGARAVGLTGADDHLIRAGQLSPELGAVGRVESVRPELIELLTAHGYLPVLACLAEGAQGELYNVNADQMAAAVAVACGVDRLFFLTDVEGVLDPGQQLIPDITDVTALDLIAQGVATGGMEAKLRACADAVNRGVPRVHIAAGKRLGVLEELRSGEPIGTSLRPQ